MCFIEFRLMGWTSAPLFQEGRPEGISEEPGNSSRVTLREEARAMSLDFLNLGKGLDVFVQISV
jgi:hypothetical protein